MHVLLFILIVVLTIMYSTSLIGVAGTIYADATAFLRELLKHKYEENRRLTSQCFASVRAFTIDDAIASSDGYLIHKTFLFGQVCYIPYV